jgi:succinylglutamate desuccinylase
VNKAKKLCLTNEDIARWIDQYMVLMKLEEDLTQYKRFNFTQDLVNDFKCKISKDINFVKSTKGTVLTTALVINCILSEENQDFIVFFCQKLGKKIDRHT